MSETGRLNLIAVANLLLTVMVALLYPVRMAGAPAVDFNREIRPILADNCFSCHGPDDKERKAGLRLDRKEDALKPLKSGEFAIVPGASAQSLLAQRITTTEEADVMPPPKTGKKLTPQQIDVLTRWIDAGAPWQEHWAFTKPERPAPPEVHDQSWPRNEIDHFVLARLEKEGLRPAPEADKTTLARRTTLDLTGLPPTPQEVEALLADPSPDANDRLVNRLLESPRYGEHMARYWLDAARYADSHGYHIDSERSMWKWREWVIDAFNKNQPYDQFTKEQLAGDLLPKPTTDQKVASGYVRCNMSTGEGGAIEQEYQAKYTFDRVETTSTIWLGLTMTCARCHTHKYDPISQREYYSLYAFFNNLDEPVMDGNRPNPDPFIKLPSPEQAERQTRLKKEIEEGQAKLDAPMPELDQAQGEWLAQWRRRLGESWTVLNPGEIKSLSSNGPGFRVLADLSVLAQGPNPESDVHEVTLTPQPGLVTALRLEALPHESLPKQGAARADDGGFRLSEFEAEILPALHEPANGLSDDPKPQKLKFATVVADSAMAEREAVKAIDGKPETGWQPDSAQATNGHTALFILAEPARLEPGAALRLRLRYEASKSKRAIGRFRLAAAQNEALIQWLNPPKTPPWHVVGPFKTEGLQHGFTNIYDPERKVDLQKSYAGVREEIKWQPRPEFEEGKNQLLVSELHGVHGAYYFARTLQVPTARTVDVSLRGDTLLKLWVNGQLVAQRHEPEKLDEGPVRVAVRLTPGENRLLVKVVNHQGACNFMYRQEVRDDDSLPAGLAAVLATAASLNEKQQQQAKVHFRRLRSPDYKQRHEHVAQCREEAARLEQTIPTTMVARELAKTRETFLLMRGEYDKPGEKVTPGVPAILPPFPAGAPTNRLGLASWLLDPAHPLTARVTVNRFWQQFFGIGLVKTTEDFGVQGEMPSHPELLDWLATEFVRSGWDVKHLVRLIVSSATYRQSSRVTPNWLARDPENRLLARGPRFRMEAEMLRDTALAVSGLLVERRGGRSVKPYEPPGLWEAVSYNNAQKYVPDKDEGQYRRSLYTYWKRQSPPPNMLIFDAPTREYCVVRRLRTNTPLQALVLMNDPQFVEAARALAHRLMTETGGDAAQRIRLAFLLATSRAPDPEETNLLLGIYQRQLADFQKHRSAAEQLLGAGGFQPKAGLDACELAAWTTIASMILNLDETVTKG